MNIKRAKEELKNTIRAYLAKNSYGEYEIPVMGQRPVLLMGPPGIGKTQIMEQVARECGIGLVAYTITHHTRQSAIGLPFISEQTYGEKAVSVTQYTMSEIVAAVYNKMEETGLKEGILFIDEINCVSETLAPAMLQFLQYKTFGNHKIPDGWIIAAAGNPPEFNKSVREFDIATLDRVKQIFVEPDFAVWKEYAVRMEVHPAILSYLTARPPEFLPGGDYGGWSVFATPRGWEDLSGFLTVYEKLGISCDREVVSQYIPHGGSPGILPVIWSFTINTRLIIRSMRPCPAIGAKPFWSRRPELPLMRSFRSSAWCWQSSMWSSERLGKWRIAWSCCLRS